VKESKNELKSEAAKEGWQNEAKGESFLPGTESYAEVHLDRVHNTVSRSAVNRLGKAGNYHKVT